MIQTSAIHEFKCKASSRLRLRAHHVIEDSIVGIGAQSSSENETAIGLTGQVEIDLHVLREKL